MIVVMEREQSIKSVIKFWTGKHLFIAYQPYPHCFRAKLGPVLLTLLRHVARILANGRAAFFESCDAIGWNSCDVSQKR